MAPPRPPPAIETLAVHAGEHPRVDGAAVFPIFQSATFLYRGETNYDDIRYARCNNCPNSVALGRKLAALEGTEAAMVTASGMAAITTTLLTFLRPGDHLLTARALYGGTYDFTKADLREMGVSVSRVDVDDPASWDAELTERTRVFYCEALSNPLVECGDLAGIAAFCRRHGLLSVIDATFATPVLCRPVADLGFDIVLHSATKALNGHSDLSAGCYAGRRELVGKITHRLNHLGGTLDPHACFLLQRGLKTLALRVRQQCANALALCQLLERHPRVLRVNYPGLESSRHHARAVQYFGGAGGGLFSFEVAGGVEAADAFLNALQYGLSAPSLGGVETLVTRPCTTSHAGLSPADLAAAGISETLIRVAVGIEATCDLLADFEQALGVACDMQ